MTIHLSQVILVGALLLFIIYVYRLRSILLERVIYLVCALAGVILVIAPDLSTWVANALGIGRGVDLLVYLFIVVSLFYAVSLRARIKRMEQQLTALVRQMALNQPVKVQPVGDEDYQTRNP